MIDWQQIILNLNARGYSCARIARVVGSKQSHIARIARGEVAEPKFNTGVKLLDLHFDVCPDKHHQTRMAA